jgi:hypothetical protein
MLQNINAIMVCCFCLLLLLLDIYIIEELDSVYVKFVGRNCKDSHRHHVSNY